MDFHVKSPVIERFRGISERVTQALAKRRRTETLKGQGARRIFGQAEFERIPLEADWSSIARFIFSADINTTCPLIGVYPVDEEGVPCGNELIFPNLGSALSVAIPLPKEARQVALRNATSSTVCSAFNVQSYRLTGLDEITRSVHDDVLCAEDKHSEWVLIHSLGKTGTISLELSIKHYSRIDVDRDHFINLPAIYAHGASQSHFLSKVMNTEKFLRSAEIYKNLSLHRKNDRKYWVLTGLRQPESAAVSSVFQNHGNRFISQNLSVSEAIFEVEKLVESFSVYLESWWRDEFFSLHNKSLERLRDEVVRDGCIWRMPIGGAGAEILLYRIEDGDSGLKRCLQLVTGDTQACVIRGNIAEHKPYAELYRQVRARIDFDRLRKRRSNFINQLFSVFYE